MNNLEKLKKTKFLRKLYTIQYKISELCDEYGIDFNLSYNNNNSINLSITPRLTINKITTNITIKTDNN
ncbi:MAG: hypothetical protein WDA02_04915 [Saccharofermentanales bacterium]